MTSSRYKRLTGFVLIVAIALVTGFLVGKIYVDNLEPPTQVSAEESSLRESEETIKDWVEQAESGKSATSFSAVELYNIAEYKLYNADKYYKVMTGKVSNTFSSPQEMRGIKIFNDGILAYDKLSPSSIPIANICSRIVYDTNTGKIKINSNGSWAGGTADITGVFDKNKFDDYTLEEYKEKYNTIPTNVMPYIISSITCSQEGSTTPVVSNGDGTYSFSIKLSGDNLTLAALYYSYEIQISSGAMNLPTWKSLQMNVTIDEDFNFKTISYVEIYGVKMNILGGISATVTDNFVDNFYFGDAVPEIPADVKEIL